MANRGREPDAQAADHPHLIPASRFNWLAFLIIAFAGIVIVGLFIAAGIVVALGVMGLVATAISMGWNRLALEELTYDMEVFHRRVEVGETVPITVVARQPKARPRWSGSRWRTSSPTPSGWSAATSSRTQTRRYRASATSPRWARTSA